MEVPQIDILIKKKDFYQMVNTIRHQIAQHILEIITDPIECRRSVNIATSSLRVKTVCISMVLEAKNVLN